MDKYRIVPESNDALKRLILDMELTKEEREAVHRLRIRHVEVCPATNSWEVLLITDVQPDQSLMDRLADHIKNRQKLKMKEKTLQKTRKKLLKNKQNKLKCRLIMQL